jgi:hypothetical protein
MTARAVMLRTLGALCAFAVGLLLAAAAALAAAPEAPETESAKAVTGT